MRYVLLVLVLGLVAEAVGCAEDRPIDGHPGAAPDVRPAPVESDDGGRDVGWPGADSAIFDCDAAREPFPCPDSYDLGYRCRRACNGVCWCFPPID